MDSELVPMHRPSRQPAIKDISITILALCLCVCLAALIHETRKRQEFSKLYSEQVMKLEAQRRASAQALASAEQRKVQSDQALRRAQLSLKAGYEAQGIVLQLRQSGARSGSR